MKKLKTTVKFIIFALLVVPIVVLYRALVVLWTWAFWGTPVGRRMVRVTWIMFSCFVVWLAGAGLLNELPSAQYTPHSPLAIVGMWLVAILALVWIISANASYLRLRAKGYI